MIRPNKLKYGSRVAIISPSKGIAGEKFAIHETLLGTKRLCDMGLVPIFMPNSLLGMEKNKENPKKRAEDFISSFLNSEIDMILPSIGGVDTFLIIPYLCKNKKFCKKLNKSKKIFVGYGDATVNHLFLYKNGLVSFYGPNFLADFAEFGDDMLPYTKSFFEHMFNSEEKIEILNSEIWYKDRENYDISKISENRVPIKEKKGFEILFGSNKRSGILLGGNLESLHESYVGNRFPNQKKVLKRYGILPKIDEWNNKILFFDTNEHSYEPEIIKKMLYELDKYIVFSNLNGVIIAKPINEKYYEEYKKIYKDFFKSKNVPVIYNVNFGHASPRCFIPYGINCEIDFDNKKIFFDKMFD